MKLNLKQYVGREQLSVMRQLCHGEEGEHFVSTIQRIKDTIAAMPVTGETAGQGDQAMVALHYFSGSSDWWIIERDIGCEDDEIPGIQMQAYGFACLNGWTDCAELGYINIQELIDNGVELDLYWQPKPLADVKAALWKEAA